jgi:hypothetical protein
MDYDQNGNQVDGDAWALSRLGYAIDRLVDREINAPQRITGQTGYGINEYGELYQLGQNGTAYTPAAPKPINWPFLLLVGGGLYLLTKD